jgi:hypothetical protein
MREDNTETTHFRPTAHYNMLVQPRFRQIPDAKRRSSRAEV